MYRVQSIYTLYIFVLSTFYLGYIKFRVHFIYGTVYKVHFMRLHLTCTCPSNLTTRMSRWLPKKCTTSNVLEYYNHNLESMKLLNMKTFTCLYMCLSLHYPPKYTVPMPVIYLFIASLFSIYSLVNIDHIYTIYMSYIYVCTTYK